MAQYNILSIAKRFEEYETLGSLFRQANADALQLTISERIWGLILNIVAKLTQILDIDPEMLMEKLILDDEELTKLINLKPYMQAG